jgi:type II secretory pathway pseudopilin PulG
MRRRNAFTIVELLVAMALIMFIMAILSTAFAAATTTFRNLKAIGDMANKLRAITTLLQRDLAADHFEGKKRLSSPNFWVNGPPSQGYFRIWQGSPGTQEGNDIDGFPSYRSVDHMLAFTIKLRGDQMSDFLTAGPNGGGTVLGSLTQFGPAEARYQSANTYNYQWAEVAWFLQPQIDPNTLIQDTTSGGVPLYTLYRIQRLAVPDNNLVPAQPAGSLTSFLEMSCWVNGANLYFNSPMDLTVPPRRFGMNPANPAGIFATGTTYPTLAQQVGVTNLNNPLYNADIQATDVISFDVRVLPAPTMPIDPTVTLFEDLFTLTSTNYQSTMLSYYNSNPLFYNPATDQNPAVFDTWSSLTDGLSDYSQWNVAGHPASIPLWNQTTQAGPIIQAIQVTIRIWDMRTQQTREVTLVQAM